MAQDEELLNLGMLWPSVLDKGRWSECGPWQTGGHDIQRQRSPSNVIHADIEDSSQICIIPLFSSCMQHGHTSSGRRDRPCTSTACALDFLATLPYRKHDRHGCLGMSGG